MTVQARYTPPAFGLIEWVGETELAARWLASWQGLVGSPAEQVCLGWRSDSSTAVVATQHLDRDPSEVDRRRTALLILLAGDQLVGASKPKGAAELQQLVSELGADGSRWHRTSVMVDRALVPVQVIWYADDILVGYLCIEDKLVAFAYSGCDKSEPKFRRLGGDGSRYPLDPRLSATSAQLSLQQPAS